MVCMPYISIKIILSFYLIMKATIMQSYTIFLGDKHNNLN